MRVQDAQLRSSEQKSLISYFMLTLTLAGGHLDFAFSKRGSNLRLSLKLREPQQRSLIKSDVGARLLAFENDKRRFFLAHASFQG